MSFAIQKLLRGDRKSIALAISEAEDFPQRAAESAKSILQHTGNAHVIGITGPPGSGKSSLAVKLALEFCKTNSKVAILAIDPSSHTSGGAFMGNRVRMQEAYDNKRIYIRSMASRGDLGGLSRAAFLAVNILDAAGMSYIIIETIGAGQVQTEIVNIAHTVVIVLQPDVGDSIQASKAGLSEIGDIFVINKSDLPGAEKAANHLADLWSAGYNARLGWKPRILKTCSIGKEAEGILKLKKAINEHYQFLTLAGKIRDRLPKALEAELLATIKCILFDRYLKSLDADTFEGILADVVAGKIGVHNAAMELVSQFTKSSPKGVCNNRQK